MENEMLQQILNKLNSLETKVDKLDSLETKIDNGFANVDKRFDQLYSIKTEISIMKSSMGEHEMDLKYLKKVK